MGSCEAINSTQSSRSRAQAGTPQKCFFGEWKCKLIYYHLIDNILLELLSIEIIIIDLILATVKDIIH